MRISPTQALNAMIDLSQKWEVVCPTQSFFGLTLAQYRARIQPSLDSRAALANLERQMKIELERRHTADEASVYLVNGVVNAIKGDPTQGEDGELYGALGYVRKSKRANNRARARVNEAPQPAVETKPEEPVVSGPSSALSGSAMSESKAAA